MRSSASIDDTVRPTSFISTLDACRAGLPDFVLLDWNMPVMDGLTFLRALRKSAAIVTNEAALDAERGTPES